MRREFVTSLCKLAERDERVVLLTGDLGFAVLEPFRDRFPRRFINAGVAEQNMMGVATGLAEAGFTPFVYSIATFASMRGYEFIRDGAVIHRLPVRIVGVGEGVDYGHNGTTHHALEDLALMRAQPGMAVVCPNDRAQIPEVLDAIQALSGPAYLRLAKLSLSVPGLGDRFRPGRVERIVEGADLAVVAAGSMVPTALACAELLADRGIAASVTAVPQLSPVPEDDLVALLSEVPSALTIEAHYVTGGLGSMVAEIIAEHGLDCRLVRGGFRDPPVGVSGDQDYMHARLGLSPEALADAVLRSPGGQAAAPLTT